MKKILVFSLLTAILLTICGCRTNHNAPLIPESPARDFDYEMRDGEVIITKYIGTDQKIRIPAMIKGRPVTEIGGSAFKEYDMTYLYIPENVETIGYNAFAYCRLLENVVLPKSLQSLGSGIFEGCESLVSIQIPDAVTVLEFSAFRGCSSLKHVKLPDNLKVIEDNAFWSCSSLEKIVLPTGLLEIEGNAFWSCKRLTEIVLPDSLQKIGGGAFGSCTSLKEIELPDGLMLIESSAFSKCESLRELRIPDETRIETEFQTVWTSEGTVYVCQTPISGTYMKNIPTFTTILNVKEDSPAHKALIGCEEYGIKYEVR